MARLPLFAFLWLAGCAGGDDQPGGAGRLPDDDRDGYTTDADCDDGDPAVNPGIGIDACNGVDDDCDGDTDEDPEWGWYPDNDRDGFGDGAAAPVLSCGEPSGTVASHSDCDDGDPGSFPGNDESCDGVDNDCDGTVDEGGTSIGTWYTDADADGAGDPGAPVGGCTAPPGAVDNTLDCDDTDPGDPIFVAVTGSGSGAGRIGSPLSRVQDGLTRSHGCVVVLPGTYRENLEWPGTDILVISRDGPETTILDGGGGGPVVSFFDGEGPGAILDGFTLTGGSGFLLETTYVEGGDTTDWYHEYRTWFGGGLFIVGSSPTLRNLVIRDILLPTHADYWDETGLMLTTYDSVGGGVYIESGSPTFEDIDVRGTYGYTGGAFFVNIDADVQARRVGVYGVGSGYASIAVSGGSLAIENLIMDAPTSESGWAGLLVSAGRLHILNSTLVEAGASIGNWGSSDVVVRNTIVAGGDYGFLNYEESDLSTVDLAYNDFYGNDSGNYYGVSDPTGSDGNLNVSPRFTSWNAGDGDPDNDDLTLTGSSSCVDAGDPAVLDEDGSRSDMGGYGGTAGSW